MQRTCLHHEHIFIFLVLSVCYDAPSPRRHIRDLDQVEGNSMRSISPPPPDNPTHYSATLPPSFEILTLHMWGKK